MGLVPGWEREVKIAKGLLKCLVQFGGSDEIALEGDVALGILGPELEGGVGFVQADEPSIFEDALDITSCPSCHREEGIFEIIVIFGANDAEGQLARNEGVTWCSVGSEVHGAEGLTHGQQSQVTSGLWFYTNEASRSLIREAAQELTASRTGISLKLANAIAIDRVTHGLDALKREADGQVLANDPRAARLINDIQKMASALSEHVATHYEAKAAKKTLHKGLALRAYEKFSGPIAMNSNLFLKGNWNRLVENVIYHDGTGSHGANSWYVYSGLPALRRNGQRRSSAGSTLSLSTTTKARS